MTNVQAGFAPGSSSCAFLFTATKLRTRLQEQDNRRHDKCRCCQPILVVGLSLHKHCHNSWIEPSRLSSADVAKENKKKDRLSQLLSHLSPRRVAEACSKLCLLECHIIGHRRNLFK